MADIRQLLLEAAARYGVPAPLALGLAKQESNFKPGAISPAGAIGVMQLMPGTAKELGVDPYDVNQNIDGGMRYLKAQIDKFGVPMGLAAYNAGPGRVQKHLASGSPLPAETQKYIPAVLANAQGMGASGMPMQNVPQIPGSAPTLPPTFTPPQQPVPAGPTMTADAGAPLSLSPPAATAPSNPLGSLGGMMQLAQLFGGLGGGSSAASSAPAPAPMPLIPPPQPPPMAMQALAQMLQNPSYEQAAPGRRFYTRGFPT